MLVNIDYPRSKSGERKDLRGEKNINFFFTHPYFVYFSGCKQSITF